MVLQLSIQRLTLNRCKSEKRKEDVTFTAEKPGVSVVVYAHNQGDALLRNLPMIFDNNYPDFEVIVVDDNSNDETPNVLTLMEQRSEHFIHTKMTDKVRTVSRKKLALLLGVKAAHHDIILTTHAQCMPSSPDWISNMVRNFTQWTDAVIGPVVFEGRTGIISRFCQYDLFQRMASLFGMTLAIKPFAGWGQNMAFRKSVFFANANQAISRHLDIEPGEDDLFISEIARKDNVAVECTPESIMIDQQTPIFKAWRKDRLCRAFTSRKYAIAPRVVELLDFWTRYFCVFSGLLLAVIFGLKSSWALMALMLVALLIRVLCITLISYLTSKELGIHRYIFSPVIYDLYIPLVNLWFKIKSGIRHKQFRVGKI